jgi:tetratricopeptide (TPR) repeat protein
MPILTNRAAVLTSVLLLLSANTVLVVKAAEPLYSMYYQEGSKLFKEKRLQEALDKFKEAEKNSEHLKPDSLDKAKLDEFIGQIYCRLGEDKQAEDYLKKTLAIKKNVPKIADWEIYGTMMMLGTVYRNANRFEESEQLYKQGLSMFQGKGPLKVLIQATTLYALGTLYLEMSRPADAKMTLEAAIKLRNQTMLKANLDEQGLLDALGRAYRMEQRLGDAEMYLNKALAMAEDKKSLDSIAFTKVNLGSVYDDQGRYAEARKLMEEAREILEKLHGPDSSQVATCCSNLAEVAINQDRYAEAESLIARAVGIHEKLHGASHTSVGCDLSKMISILRNQGKYAKAEETARVCVDLFTKTLGPDKQETAQAHLQLALVLLDEKKLPEAEKESRTAIAILDKLNRSVARAIALINLAEIEQEMKNVDEARKLFKEVAIVGEGNKDFDPAGLARVYSDLAKMDIDQEKFGDAEASLRKSLAVREKLYGIDSPRTLGDRKLLEKVLEEQKKTTDAQVVMAQIQKIVMANPDLKEKPSKIKTGMIGGTGTGTGGDTTTRTTVPTSPVSATSANASPIASKDAIRNRYALVVGISNFADPAINLRYAAKDAVDFAKFLTSDAHFPVDNVKLLTDKDATRDNIIKQLGGGWLGRRAGPDDLVVIYVSSHGSTAKDEAGGVNFLVAHDTEPEALLSTGIPMQWLSQIIKEQVHARRVVLVMDVCHSGASAGGQKGLIRENQFDLTKVPIGEGQAIICSSAPEQVSWESKTYANSVFTRKLIEGLKQNNGQADLNQAFAYLKDQVEAEVLRDRGKLQTPIFFNKNWQGPAPVLTVSTAVRAPGAAGGTAGAASAASANINNRTGVRSKVR